MPAMARTPTTTPAAMAATFDFLLSGTLVAEAEEEGVTTTVVFWGATVADVTGAAVDVEDSVELDTASGSSASGRELAIPVS